MRKFSFWHFALFLFVIWVVISLILTPISEWVVSKYLPKGNDDWIGFFGNIVGGILGGVSTLLGVIYAFRLEDQKAFIEQIPDKIVSITIISQEINKHKFHVSVNNKLNAKENANLLLEQIAKFNNQHEEYLKKAAQVDTDIFTTIQSYYDSLEIIRINMKLIIERNDLKYPLEQEVQKAKVFHINLLEIAKDILDQKEKYYIQYLHKQKKPQNIIQRFKDHEYLKEIKKKQNLEKRS